MSSECRSIEAIWGSLIRTLVGVVVLLFLYTAPSSAAGCPSLQITQARAENGATFSLAKIRAYLNHPTKEQWERLILVTAHRGDWEICPENTIEGAMLAMDKKAELIELDLRITKDGVPYLSHDWDLRGEALNPNTTEATVNNIYLLTNQELQDQHRVKLDRYGHPAKNADGNPIIFQTLYQFLDIYYERARLLPHGISSDDAIQQGTEIVLDIKGSEKALVDTIGNGATQLEALRHIMQTVSEWENNHNVSLKQALIYKVNLKAMVADEKTPTQNPIYPDHFMTIAKESGLKYNPGLIFIVYPENWNVGNGTRNFYKPLLESYQSEYKGDLYGVDWQSRFPKINLEEPQREDVAADRGVGAFVAYNPFPEGIRRSEGTCTFQGDALKIDKDTTWRFGPPCLAQGIMQWASAALEFFFPPKVLGLPVFATNITTDMYENARNYLAVTRRRDLSLIEWDKQQEPQRNVRTHGDPEAASTQTVRSKGQVSSAGELDPRQSAVGDLGPLGKGKKVFDLGLNADCRPGWLDNMVDKKCVNYTWIKTGPQGLYFSIDDEIPPTAQWRLQSVWRFPDQNVAKEGFTIAIELDPVAARDLQQIVNVFSVVGTDGRPLFSVLRGKDGAWYTGKQIDRVISQSMSFDTKLWDPKSPCVNLHCIDETLYVSFQSTGEVRLDDVAVFDDGKVNWQAGLMNYGLPLRSYQPGTETPHRDWPNWPVQKPDFMPIGGISLAALARDFYGEPNQYQNPDRMYSGARIKRITIWSGGMIGDEEIVPQKGWTNLTNVFRNVEKAIIEEHNARQLAAAANKKDVRTLMLDYFLPCNTGQFQINIPNQDRDAIYQTTQYRPDVATPCMATGKRVPEPKFEKGIVCEYATPEDPQ